MDTNIGNPGADAPSPQPVLLEVPPAEPPAPAAPAPRAPRVRQANRTQVCLRRVDLKGLLPEDHRTRVVWQYVEGLDLTPLYQGIEAVEGEAGRPASGETTACRML